jgi:hypothetical protein
MPPNFDKLPRSQLVLLVTILFGFVCAIGFWWVKHISATVRETELRLPVMESQLSEINRKIDDHGKKLDTIIYKGLRISSQGGDGDI